MKHSITTYNTKKLMAESLKRVMHEKPVSKITVTEIVKDCGINRKTFYYHFQDIFELLKWMFQQETTEVLKQFKIINNCEKTIYFIMDYIDKNEEFLRSTYNALGHDVIRRIFYEDFREIVSSHINNTESEYSSNFDENYKQFLCYFYVDALTGTLIDYIKNRKDRNKKQIAHYLIFTFKSSMSGIIKNQTSLSRKE